MGLNQLASLITAIVTIIIAVTTGTAWTITTINRVQTSLQDNLTRLEVRVIRLEDQIPPKNKYTNAGYDKKY